MNHIALIQEKQLNLAVEEDISEVISTMIRQDQVECPVVHHFGPGVYIREIHMPKGAFVIGHWHRGPHLNIMLTGELDMVDEHGGLTNLKAPLIKVAPAGRKVAIIREDTVWQNIYATEETDVEKLEEMFLDKDMESDDWKEYMEQEQAINEAFHQDDREDFLKFCEEFDLTPEQVRGLSETEEDQIPMPYGYANVTVRDSYIEGKGIFLSAPVKCGQVIGPARLGDKRTPLGRFTNHSADPNAMFVNVKDRIIVVAIKDIAGCLGGGKGEEVTVDYRQAIKTAQESNEGSAV